VTRSALALVLALPFVGLVSSAEPAASWQAAVAGIPMRGLDGRPFTVAEFRGKVVVLDVWATWCAPCLAELPTLRRLSRGEAGRDVAVIGVNLDRINRRDLRAWLGRHAVGWPQHFDGRGYASPVADALDVRQLPATFLLDREGQVVARGLRGDRLIAAAQLLTGAEHSP
jgi:thiol-disulfide isomerase/thioredoxin